MSVAVLIPTRSRPAEFLRAVESVRKTSKATVLAYVDEDQNDMYPIDGEVDGAIICRGPRVGPVSAANFLVNAHRDFDAYGLITDDSRIITPGWDDYVLDCYKNYSRYMVVSPHHNHGEHVDMPFLSREWINLVGWYACPEFFHYCWPIVCGLIGEMTGIVHCPKNSFSIDHDYQENTHMHRRTADNARFFDYVSLKMPAVVELVRGEM